MGRTANQTKPNVALIRELMRKKELTIKDLAEKIGRTRETLSRVLNEKEPCTEENLQNIASELGCPVDSLRTSTEQLMKRWIERQFVQLSLTESPVEMNFKDVVEIAVRLGFLKEVSAFDVI